MNAENNKLSARLSSKKVTISNDAKGLEESKNQMALGQIKMYDFWGKQCNISVFYPGLSYCSLDGALHWGQTVMSLGAFKNTYFLDQSSR